VLLAKQKGKTVKYYLTGPKSTKAHRELGICSASKDEPVMAKATGEVREKENRKVMEVSKIEKVDTD
jgi:hypothetical protein